MQELSKIKKDISIVNIKKWISLADETELNDIIK